VSGTELVRYDAMCSAIAAAYSVDEVKDIRDKARAIEVYSRQAHNVEAERQACEIRLRAERKWGQLRETEVAQPGRPKSFHDESIPKPKTLGDLGVSEVQSHRWQKLAAIPDGEFEQALHGPGKPTTSGIIAAHAEPKRSPCDPRALWLWGRLLDFEREGLLAADPDELIGSMLEHMQETTKRLAPRVAAWLRRIANDG
jgi:hypothetical protein